MPSVADNHNIISIKLGSFHSSIFYGEIRRDCLANDCKVIGLSPTQVFHAMKTFSQFQPDTTESFDMIMFRGLEEALLTIIRYQENAFNKVWLIKKL